MPISWRRGMIAPADCSLPGSWAYEAMQARSSSAAKLSEYDSLVRWEALCSAQKAVTWSNNGNAEAVYMKRKTTLLWLGAPGALAIGCMLIMTQPQSIHARQIGIPLLA